MIELFEKLKNRKNKLEIEPLTKEQYNSLLRNDNSLLSEFTKTVFMFRNLLLILPELFY